MVRDSTRSSAYPPPSNKVPIQIADTTIMRRVSDPPDTDIWRPLRTLGFALQYRVFGTHAAGYHAVSLLLHLEDG